MNISQYNLYEERIVSIKGKFITFLISNNLLGKDFFLQLHLVTWPHIQFIKLYHLIDLVDVFTDNLRMHSNPFSLQYYLMI